MNLLKQKKILHGAGQIDNPFNYPTDFKAYWDIVTYKPQLFITYVQLKYVNIKWFELTKKQIKDFPDVILQIGLSMSDTPSGEPDKHYESDVLEGKYDRNIEEMCVALNEWRKPCFIRLGYEFNGLKWYGYNVKYYAKTWKYVVDKCRKNNVKNVIWVWHYSPEGESNYMDYYPGDDFVDWWGISIFKQSDFGKHTIHYLEAAKEHGKPIMIAESSPVLLGINNEKVWNEWFKKYFHLIKLYGIDAFCYINSDWSKTSVWKDWKNCQLSNNPRVLKKYNKELLKLKGEQK